MESDVALVSDGEGLFLLMIHASVLGVVYCSCLFCRACSVFVCSG